MANMIGKYLKGVPACDHNFCKLLPIDTMQKLLLLWLPSLPLLALSSLLLKERQGKRNSLSSSFQCVCVCV